MSDNGIPAATILLLRDAPQLEVLMIERHQNVRFAGGALVFPGGRIGESDYEPKWREWVSGYDGVPENQRAPRIAAIREAFEETGILLAARQGESVYLADTDVEALTPWRKRIENDDALFLELIKQENLMLACDRLRLFAHWSPAKEATHRRYDTLFFVAIAPEGQTAREDGNEATETFWARPKAALEARDNGSRKLIFPTSRNVELLGVSNSAASAMNYAERRTIERIEPVVVDRDGKMMITIPDHLGYPITEEAAETALRS